MKMRNQMIIKVTKNISNLKRKRLDLNSEHTKIIKMTAATETTTIKKIKLSACDLHNEASKRL